MYVLANEAFSWLVSTACFQAAFGEGPLVSKRWALVSKRFQDCGSIVGTTRDLWSLSMWDPWWAPMIRSVAGHERGGVFFRFTA